MQTKTSPRETLLRRASRFHHAGVWCEDGSYVKGTKWKPKSSREYQNEFEPVIDASDLYDGLEDAVLTVNAYNALVLNSTNLLMVDVDMGDPRLNTNATVTSKEQVIDSLKELNEFDEEYFCDIHWASQSWRLYETAGGFRLICTSMPVPWSDWWWDTRVLMRWLWADPEYIRLCQVQKCYRARLTPKPWRDNDDGLAYTCRLIYEQGHEVHPDLLKQLRLHDDLTGTCDAWDEAFKYLA